MSGEAPIAVLVELKVKEGADQEFLAALRELLGRIREEPACTSIHGYQDPSDPTGFFVVEVWDSAEEFAEFDGDREYLHRYLERVEPLWADPRRRRIGAEVA